MFVDAVSIKFTAGRGGDGIVAWRREKFIPKGGPVGGNGGKGGSIYLECDPQIHSLDFYRNRKWLSADKGSNGGSNNKQGQSGKDLILKVPAGTLVKDAASQEVLYDLIHPHEKIQLCAGGKGGKGNSFFRTPTNQAPTKFTRGTLGESREIDLELKMIADIGLIGMPNAGKSTLLTQLTNCRAKIGAYPFTTLHPNLSFIEFEDFSRIYIADIPGLIDDAHLNKGLGHAFLKHIERTEVLVYLIDISATEGRDPFDDFLTLQKQLKEYSADILSKPYLIALNKIDTPHSKKQVANFRKKCSSQPLIYEISAQNKLGLSPLVEQMRMLSQKKGKHFC